MRAPSRHSAKLEGQASASRGPGRPALGGRDTRVDLVDAARALFAEFGFDRTTMRAVAARAGVDAALIYHHFGSKDDLLSAALAIPAGAEAALRAIPAGTADPGAMVATRVLSLWENDPTVRDQALAMFRTALSNEHAAELIRATHTRAVAALVAEIVAEDNRELRAALIGAQLMGVLLTRYLFQTHIVVETDSAVLVAAIGPVIDHYLTGDLSQPDDKHSSARMLSS